MQIRREGVFSEDPGRGIHRAVWLISFGLDVLRHDKRLHQAQIESKKNQPPRTKRPRGLCVFGKMKYNIIKC